MDREIYAAQVLTGREDKYINSFRRLRGDFDNVEIYYPKRELEERKRGETRRVKKGIFSGYLFIKIPEGDIKNYQQAFRETEGFLRFLKANNNITPLKGRDKELIQKFINFPNATIENSIVYFNEKDRIEVISGVLKGMEGDISSVNRRKGRARISLKLFNENVYVDFSIKEIKHI
ncbi:MAG: antitermination protein NusG [Spirochaetaceae bacterium]|jgi:transcriptional antiterminator NusG|nr:antitermination protein NusG [Spirochaetaceae bacterium]